MVRCGARDCRGSPSGFFHVSCAGGESIDYFCSRRCRRSKEYVYCVCHRKRGTEEQMLSCELGKDCEGDEWYHIECLQEMGVNADNLPGRI